MLLLSRASAFAQTDEIQVYDAEIAEPGVLNLMAHNNYTPDGLTQPRFSGGLVPNHTLNGVPEWAYGVTDWFEQGLYLPLYSESSNLGPVLNGFKVRELFVVPHAAEQTFFYGINFEFSYNAKHWDPDTYSSEIRPIMGLHLGKFDRQLLEGLQKSRFRAISARRLQSFKNLGGRCRGVRRFRRNSALSAHEPAVATAFCRRRLQRRCLQHRSRARSRADQRFRSASGKNHGVTRPLHAAEKTIG
jgi:hypothetical protein